MEKEEREESERELVRGEIETRESERDRREENESVIGERRV